MPYIPPDAKWYLADIVEELVIQDEESNIVHTNLILVRADSPEEAYEKAMLLGRERDMQYTNPEGKTVKVTFRGLRDLNVVHGDLAHGTELIYQRHIGMRQQDLDKWVSRKEDLGVFSDNKKLETPNY